MKKNLKRIPFVKETVLGLSLQSARGGGEINPATTSVQVTTFSDNIDCPSVGSVIVSA